MHCISEQLTAWSGFSSQSGWIIYVRIISFEFSVSDTDRQEGLTMSSVNVNDSKVMNFRRYMNMYYVLCVHYVFIYCIIIF